MPTLIDLEYSEDEMCLYFTNQTNELKSYVDGPINAGIYVLNDGFVYFHNDVFAISNEGNNVREVIITDKNKLGIILIDTKETSKDHPQLIEKLEEFLVLLNVCMISLSKDNNVKITHMPDRTTDEIKEELLILHAI